MFICIDGSGPDDDGEYERAFRHSFLVQALAASTQARKRWHRGPNGQSGHQIDLDLVTREAVELYHADRAADGDNARVFLGGYSRGAAGMVHVAYRLREQGITVNGMFLFDAVDRSLLIGDPLIFNGSRTTDVDVVPANVAAVRHARRNPAGESRESFDNTATSSAAGPGAYLQGFFLTTHGGMGGALWGYTGLDDPSRALYEERHATEAARARLRHTETLVEPFLGWTGAADEALVGLFTGDPSDGRTTLTMDQEEAGAWDCIRWMWPHMVSLGAVRAGTAPQVHTRRGSFGRERF
jgi:hypothetical protein